MRPYRWLRLCQPPLPQSTDDAGARAVEQKQHHNQRLIRALAHTTRQEESDKCLRLGASRLRRPHLLLLHPPRISVEGIPTDMFSGRNTAESGSLGLRLRGGLVGNVRRRRQPVSEKSSLVAWTSGRFSRHLVT